MASRASVGARCWLMEHEALARPRAFRGARAADGWFADLHPRRPKEHYMLRNCLIGLLALAMLVLGISIGRNIIPKPKYWEPWWYPEKTDVRVLGGYASSGEPFTGEKFGASIEPD